MNPASTQHIIEFLNCASSALSNAAELETLLGEGLSHSHLSQVKTISHQFDPIGVTVLTIISESHVAIHTYPEHNHVSIDIFTCSDTKKHLRLVDFLKDHLKPEDVTIRKIGRGDTIEFKIETIYPDD